MKKGISAIIATVLLVAFTVAVAGILSIYEESLQKPTTVDNDAYCKMLMSKLSADSSTSFVSGNCQICWKKTSDVYSIGNRNYTEETTSGMLCKTYVIS
jgi:flagellin-like protein